MYPELIKIGPLTLHTYGVLVASGFLLALSLAIRQAKRQGIPHALIADIGFYILVGAIVGSRGLYVLMNLSYYLRNPFDIFKVWEGGLVFYGGLIFVIPLVIWYVKRKGLDLWAVADIMAPSLAVGHAIGRLGCFSAGCCYGAPSELPWAVTFTDPKSLAPQWIKLHPTQLYESIGEFAIFLVLISIRTRQSFKGELFWLYGVFYSALRFTVEFWRGDIERGFIMSGLSVSQALSVILFTVSAIMFIRGIKRGVN